MALPYAKEEPGELTKEEKGKALVKLFVTVLALDTIAVIGYFYLVIVLGWDEMRPLISVIVVSVITGFYFQWGKQKLNI